MVMLGALHAGADITAVVVPSGAMLVLRAFHADAPRAVPTPLRLEIGAVCVLFAPAGSVLKTDQ
jgi:hypothetical protein